MDEEVFRMPFIINLTLLGIGCLCVATDVPMTRSLSFRARTVRARFILFVIVLWNKYLGGLVSGYTGIAAAYYFWCRVLKIDDPFHWQGTLELVTVWLLIFIFIQCAFTRILNEICLRKASRYIKYPKFFLRRIFPLSELLLDVVGELSFAYDSERLRVLFLALLAHCLMGTIFAVVFTALEFKTRNELSNELLEEYIRKSAQEDS